MAKYQFLTDEWVEAARKVRAEAETPAPTHKVKMNLIITSVPFQEEPIEAHMDTTEGRLDLETGHIEEPELTVTLEYSTAKAILVDGNPQAGMQAFMAGKIQVKGDVTKLMAMQQAPPDAAAVAVAKQIQEITE